MTGVDGYDWSAFGGNPVPGDPDAVRSIAAHFADLADTAAQQNSLVRGVGSDAESIWVGPAADRFRPHVAKLPGQLDKLTRSYRDAADALNTYWPKLRAAQELAVSALAKANAARAAIGAAQSQLQSATSVAASAASSYNSAASALAASASPSPADTASVKSLQASYRSAQARVGSANAALGGAQAQMTAAQQMRDTAVANAHAASAACASALHAASAAGIQNPHHSWLSGIFDDIGSDLSSAWHWTEQNVTEGLRAAEPLLKDVSAGLGVATAVLAVASLALAPFGVGEALEVVNEGLMGLKTADDAVLLGAGDSGAGLMLGEDALAMGTGGLGRVFSDAGETLVATGEATEAAETATESGAAVTTAEQAVAGATRGAATAGGRAQAAAEDSALLRGLQSDAFAEGRPVDAISFGQQAEAKLAEQASANADQQAFLNQAEAAKGELAAAQAQHSANLEACGEAAKQLEGAQQYSPMRDPWSALKSFSGANNLSRAEQLVASPRQYLSEFASINKLEGSPAQRFAQYYVHTVTGSAGMGRLGGVLKTASFAVNMNEGITGVGHLASAAGGGGG